MAFVKHKFDSFEQLKKNVDILDIVSEYTQITRKSGQIMCKCPFHDDKTASMGIDRRKGLFHCFACGESGDVIHFLEKIGYNKSQIYKKLKGMKVEDIKIDKIPEVEIISKQVVPDDEPPSFFHPELGLPTSIYPYYKNKRLYYYTARFENKDGKSVLPLTYREFENGNKSWMWKGPDTRELYGWVGNNTWVLIVEGEKSCDVGHILLREEDIDVISFGGCQTIDKTNWLPVYGKKIMIWPDNDDPGREAADKICDILQDKCPVIYQVIIDDEEKGFDVADFKGKDVTEYIKKRLIKWERRSKEN